jgi:hypothetical protein
VNDLLHPKGKNETWVVNKFNTWRVAMDLDQSIEIETLSPQNFVNMLFSFFYMFCKGDNDRCPNGNMMCMYNAINWLLKATREKWMALLGVLNHPFFL